jgi:hypothetical protein
MKTKFLSWTLVKRTLELDFMINGISSVRYWAIIETSLINFRMGKYYET